jgi:allantoin permease
LAGAIAAILDIIGGMLGPVIGVMMAHYFIVMRGQINLDELYTIEEEINTVLILH